MAAPEDQSQPLDETMWRDPQIAQQWGGIHTNTVLHYFALSPFFDGTSNNATIQNQSQYSAEMFYLMQTREAFEGHLRSMAGLEFMVVQDPSNGGQKVENSGVWVIRKQNRRRRAGVEDEITPLAEYYVVGESIYMAPSVGSIVEGRMLSVAKSLTCLFSLASTLPIFKPAIGHVYLPPQAKPVNAASLASQQSKEGTPMPESQSARGASVLSDKPSVISADSSMSLDRQGAIILSESLRVADLHGSMYMDETPTAGEPGSFILQKAKKPAPTSFGSLAGTARGAASAAPSTTGTPVLQGKAPPQLKTTDLPAEEKKKGTKSSPASPLSPTTPGGKKRKKSKALASGVKA